MEGETKDPKRENERSNWASERLGLGPEMRNSNSGLHLILLCSVKLRTQFNKLRTQCLSRELSGFCRGGSCLHNLISCVRNVAWTTSSVLAPLHESFASNAFLSLSQALFNP
ncbi:hypothetical protein PIB30_089138 [Stylosanthes scabra]|uniref:Uncharacterized protein n=1 Tax=Stylosanthes scabra TaxID=79078 RepID=A0ABU6QTU6_9FABA|nr:hypothetical protein [Stylosanthes scabra]